VFVPWKRCNAVIEKAFKEFNKNPYYVRTTDISSYCGRGYLIMENIVVRINKHHGKILTRSNNAAMLNAVVSLRELFYIKQSYISNF
jgi:hypothetical protein